MISKLVGFCIFVFLLVVECIVFATNSKFYANKLRSWQTA